MKQSGTRPHRRFPAHHRKALPRQLNVGEAKALFSRVVDEAARGARFVIAKAGTPVARIGPLDSERATFVFGTLKGLVSRANERALLDTIEAPLPDGILAAFGGTLEAADQ